MKKLLNIVSVLTLSISPPLLVIGCGGNKNQSDVEQVVNPIVKFASYKDFLQINTDLFEPYLGEQHKCYHICPRELLTEAFRKNNLVSTSSPESYWEQFKKNISNNLDNSYNLMEKSLEVIPIKDQSLDLVDAAGEYIFPKLVKKFEEKLKTKDISLNSYVVDFYESLIPVVSTNTADIGEKSYYTVVHTEEVNSLTYKKSKYIQFDAIKPSLLWDLKPNVTGQNIERYYMGNNIDQKLLNFYEHICDMYWMKCTD